MREIEFRVWDVERSEYFIPQSIAFSKDGPAPYRKGAVIADYCEYKGVVRLILEQYTGLKDQNGVKIFEGDRVKLLYNRLGVITVAFHNGSFNISCYVLSKSEVIGNIHEPTEATKWPK